MARLFAAGSAADDLVAERDAARIRLYFREGVVQGGCQRRRGSISYQKLATEICVQGELVYTVGIGKEAIEFPFVLHIQEDEDNTTDTGGETDDIDQAADLIAGHISPGDLQVAFFHVLSALVFYGGIKNVAN